MLALHVHLLTGAYRAAHPTDRKGAEWPPHPARVHAALVDAAFGSGEIDPTREAAEAEALAWLEQQGPPVITCSWDEAWPFGAPHRGTLVGRGRGNPLPGNPSYAISDDARLAYVPVNDPDMTPKNVGSMLQQDGGRAVRKERFFPEVFPAEPVVSYGWPGAEPPPAIAAALRSLAARVARIGHASSLVALRWDDADFAPRFVPDRGGSLRLRVVEGGSTEAWKARHASGVEGTTLPARTLGYAAPAAPPAEVPAPTRYGPEWWVLRIDDGPAVSVAAAPRLARIVRSALMELGPQPPPPWWSGHAPAGAPAQDHHLAIVPLPWVGSARADGRVMGFALIPPADEPAANTALRSALLAWRNRGFVLAGEGREWSLALDMDPDAATLDPLTWRRPARRWASATPVLLDRHPGGDPFRPGDRALRAHAEAAAIVASACVRVGLPAPRTVDLAPHSPLTGVPPLGRHRALRHGAHPRPLVHALLEFDVPVAGPVLIGAGRFLGLGLFRPLFDRRPAAAEPSE